MAGDTAASGAALDESTDLSALRAEIAARFDHSFDVLRRLRTAVMALPNAGSTPGAQAAVKAKRGANRPLGGLIAAMQHRDSIDQRMGHLLDTLPDLDASSATAHRFLSAFFATQTAGIATTLQDAAAAVRPDCATLGALLGAAKDACAPAGDDDGAELAVQVTSAADLTSEMTQSMEAIAAMAQPITLAAEGYAREIDGADADDAARAAVAAFQHRYTTVPEHEAHRNLANRINF